MNTRSDPPDLLASILSDMELPARDVLAAGTPLRLVGETVEDVNGEVVFVIARALDAAATKLIEQWEQAFHLAHRKAT